MHSAIVTGAAGFIGSTLTEDLLHHGVQVLAIDSLDKYYSPDIKTRRLALLRERGAAIAIDKLQHMDLLPLVENHDVIFHTAGQPGVRGSWGRQFQSYEDNNVLATQRLLEAVRQSHRRPSVVYSSSSSVYGNASSYPTLENHLPQPYSPYGVTKLAAEHLMTLYASNFQLKTASLRYFTVYGPRQRPDMAFRRFIDAALKGDQVEVYGDGNQIRDFTYVDDVIRANISAAASAETAPGGVYNVCGGSTVRLIEAIELIGTIIGRPLRVKHAQAATGDVRQTGGDSTHFTRVTGWQPEVKLTEGLSRMVQWQIHDELLK